MREAWTPDPNGLPRPCAIFVFSTSGTLSTGSSTCGTVTGSDLPVNWTSGSYAYDGASNITAIGTSTYEYDKVGRLTARPTPARHSRTMHSAT